MGRINKLLPEKLSSYDWYLDQLTLMLKNDSGVVGQVKFYIDILKKLESEGLNFLNNVDIFNIETYRYDDLLNKLASIFGCSRRNYINGESVELSNSELIILILVTVMKNNYDGTLKTLKESYEKVCKIINDSEIGLAIEVNCFRDDNNNATANIIFGYQIADEHKSEAEHLVKLLENGFFNIKSCGIAYEIVVADKSKGSLWAKSNEAIDGGAIWGDSYWQFKEIKGASGQ